MFVLIIDDDDPDVVAKVLRQLAKDIDEDENEGGVNYSDVIGNVDHIKYEWEIFADERWTPIRKCFRLKSQ